MNLRTVAMMALILFHASTAWAVGMPVASCSGQMQQTAAGHHDTHAGMQHGEQQVSQSDCCGESDMLDCQLHCAGAVSCLIESLAHQADILPPAETATLRLGQRLPSHDFSLLRPPQPLS